LRRSNVSQAAFGLLTAAVHRRREGPVLISLMVVLETERVLRSRYAVSKADMLSTWSALLDAPDVAFEDEACLEECLYVWKDSNAEFADCLISARYRRLGGRRPDRGVDRDYRAASEWYQKAADGGFAEAQIALARLYVNGQGVAQSDRLALIWYFKVAASSSYSATVEQRQRAREQFFAVFEKANGVPVVDREAVEWYRDRASKGDAFARRGLALSYELGYRVGQNHLVALAIDTLLTHDPAAPEDDVIPELIPKNHEYRPRDFDRLLNTISQPGQFLSAIDDFIAHPPPHIIMWSD
jgi:hypothetical protein